MNAAELQFLAQIVRHRRDGRLMKYLSWFIVFSAAGLLVAGYLSERPLFGKGMFLALISGLGILWCGDFLKSAIQQNLPANAVLVPGLRAGLMRMTALLYAGCVLFSAALGWLMLGHPGYVLLAAGSLSVFILFANRYAWLNLLPSAIFIATLFVTNRPLDLLSDVVLSVGEPLLTFLGAMLLLLLGWKGLLAAFPQGGDRHWAWRSCALRRQARSRGEAQVGGVGAGGLRWLAWLRKPYAAALRTDSRPGADAGRQLMHTIGPAANDGTAIAYLALAAVAMALVLYRMSASKELVLMLMCSTTMQSVLMYVSSVVKQVARRGAEQRLYLLTPAAPAAAQINRTLMRTLLFRALRLWLLASLCVAGVDVVMQGGLKIRGVTFLIAMLLLPCAGLVLRNYAAIPAHTRETPATALMLAMVLVCTLLPLLAYTQPGLPWFGFGGAIGIGAVIGLWLRWRQVMALPPVLPAGRLAF